MAPNSALIDICKYEGEIPDGQLFEHKLDSVANAVDPDAETCVEIIRGHGFESIQEKARKTYLKNQKEARR